MKLNHKDFDGSRLVTVCENRIDALSAIQFKDEMRKMIDDGPNRVVIDLSQVEFLDSSGLGAVVAALKSKKSDQSLELASLQPAVEKVFRLTRMDTVFSIHDNASSAIEGAADAS
ncbi:anti-sigma-factor antagonist [Pacificibacter maritimus]|uniref:Anti-sigma factor antagonist n=1 Tax=Pacificibacter maritimus TaxID=762213 RepID=A0A3N4U207_9RHOB|nr:STAS domain-containing protein [Pacificibacter maritimus]RPE64863.1 anti-sigma-factor antagonist [Pacificibacter maritimus]